MSQRKQDQYSVELLANVLGATPVPASTENQLGSDRHSDVMAGVDECPARESALQDFAEALNRRFPSSIRLRRDGQLGDDIRAEPIPWYGLGRSVTNVECRPSRSLHYAAGDFYLQDAASMLPLAAAQTDTSAIADLVICDLCAAPGGKASALVEAVQPGNGFVLANEPIRSRLGALQFNLARTGSDRYGITNLDPESLADQLPHVFDLVIVDAPCSGQALLGKRKQARSSLSQKQIQHSARRQQRILQAACRLLRDGGQLVYSTCTFATQENESQIAHLVDSGIAVPLPVDRLAPYRSSDALDSCYRLWPHRDNCAGGFTASLRVQHRFSQDHTAAGAAIVNQNRRGRISSHQRVGNQSHHDSVDLAQWFDLDLATRVVTRGAAVYGWPDDAPSWVESVCPIGPELAYRSGKTWKPSHAAALLRSSRTQGINSLEIDDDDAQVLLRGGTLNVPVVGWHVARWRGRPLGWIKGDGTTAKNHLPKPARF